MTPCYRIRKTGFMWTVETYDYGLRAYTWNSMHRAWRDALRWVIT